MGRFDEQLRYRKIVLEKISQEQPIRWKNIIRDTVKETGSSTKSQIALDWLLNQNYIRRAGRGIYEMTPKGFKFLAGLLISNNPGETQDESV